MAIKNDITGDDHWFTGEDKDFVFTLYQADEVTPQNITGWTLSWRLKRSPSDADADALLTKTTAGGGIVLTTQLSGICTVSVLDSDTDAIRAGNYYHELKRTSAGTETILSYGKARLQQALHRS